MCVGGGGSVEAKRKEIKKKNCNEVLLSLSIHTEGITPMAHANVINTINFPSPLGERKKKKKKKKKKTTKSPERKLNKKKSQKEKT